MRGKRRAFFITGSDTGVGKTLVGCGLLEAAARAGLSTAAVKPVAAGADETAEGLRNADAVALRHHCSLPLSYTQINPFCYAPPVAPHIAAAETGPRMTIERMAGFCRGILMRGADLTVIEGAGGWMVPVNEREMLGQLPAVMKLPVILVVGMRLGCLNHALLSARAIAADRLELAGWVANRVDPHMERYQENLDTLRRHLQAPLLAEIPWYGEGDAASCADRFDLDALFPG